MIVKVSNAQAEEELYRRQGFGRPAGLGDRPALVIVDFLNGFADPNAFGGGNIRAAISETQGLLGFARSMEWPIAFTRVVFADDAGDANVFSRKIPSLLTLTEANPQSDIVPELAPSMDELVLRKRLPSAFAGTDLAAWLTRRRIDTVIVTGATTSGCVRASVVDAMGSGFLVIVVTDCVGDRAEGPHQASLFDMAQKYADLMTAKDIYKSFPPGRCSTEGAR